MTKLMIGMMMAATLLVVGCDKGAGGDAAKGDSKGEKGEKGDKGASGDSIGAPECDHYFKELEQCVKKHPEMKSMTDNEAQQKEAWKLGLSNAASKDATIQGCKQAADALKQTCK